MGDSVGDSTNNRRLLFVGTYTPDSDPPGGGEGIYRVRFDPETGAMAHGGVAARTPGPSFLAFHADPPTVYAVNERAEGTLTAFRVDGDAELAELGSVPTGGGSPCHVLDLGSSVGVANYANGTATVFPLGADGAPQAGGRGFPNTGSGPVTDRQEGPHAHSLVVAPDGESLLVVDLGTDELRVHRAGEPVGAIALPPGTGPRHAAVSGEYVYVAGELDSRAHVLRWDAEAGTAEHVGSVHATGEEAVGKNFPGEIAAHDGHVYVSNRGADAVSTLAVRDGGARLEHVANTAVGAWPRNFTVVRGHRDEPDHLVVAAQNGDSLASLRIDPGTGIPADTGHRLEIPVPVCVLPVPINRIRRAGTATE
ncbi:lactonase family protein [Nocardiopsis sp. NPDC058631]|uniref:lactonase family protein n=1 Tax=Nocardiopsis sp. NPDC058631 TaxID=3346566 RepID=UPI0036536BBD